MRIALSTPYLLSEKSKLQFLERMPEPEFLTVIFLSPIQIYCNQNSFDVVLGFGLTYSRLLRRLPGFQKPVIALGSSKPDHFFKDHNPEQIRHFIKVAIEDHYTALLSRRLSKSTTQKPND